MQHHMHMVAHEGIGIESDRKTFRQRQQLFFHPGLSVLVRATAVRIFAAQKSTADAARNTVKEARCLRVDHVKAWICHEYILPSAPERRYHSTARWPVSGELSLGCPR